MKKILLLICLLLCPMSVLAEELIPNAKSGILIEANSGKVIYEKKTLKILGAQIVGYDGVDKRIDVLATAIKANMKATELKDLEFVKDIYDITGEDIKEIY